MFTTGKLFEIAIVLFLMSGGILLQLITGGTSCALDNTKCVTFFKSVGNIVLSPQGELSAAINSLADKKKIDTLPSGARESYIFSLQTKIVIMTLISLMYIVLSYRLVRKLTLQDFGSSVVAFAFVVLLIGSIQSGYSYVENHTVVLPWFGFIDLFTHINIIISSSTSQLDIARNATNYI